MASLDDTKLRVENLETGESVREISFEPATQIGKFVLSSDHRYLACETYEFGTDNSRHQWVHLHLVDLSSGQRSELAKFAKGERAVGVQDQLKSMRFSPDSSRLVTLESGGLITVWDVDTRRALWKTGLETRRGLDCVLVSPDNQTVASVYDASPSDITNRLCNSVILLWSFGDPDAHRISVQRGLRIVDLAFSPDGRWLYAPGAGNSIVAVDVATLSVAKVFAPGP